MAAVQTINLIKCHGKKVAVDKLNLTVKGGELFSLLGVNGAGKTTHLWHFFYKLNVVFGLWRPPRRPFFGQGHQ